MLDRTGSEHLKVVSLIFYFCLSLTAGILPLFMKNPSLTLATVKGTWDEQSGKFKAKFSMLTDTNLSYKRNNVSVPEHKAEDATHKTKEELTAIDFSTLSTF
jgi:hypothetical protein